MTFFAFCNSAARSLSGLQRGRPDLFSFTHPPITAAMDAFLPLRAEINALGRRVVEFANPSLRYETRATRGFPLMELDVVAAILVGYLLLVVYGLFMSSCCSAREASREGAAAAALRDAARGAGTGARGWRGGRTLRGAGGGRGAAAAQGSA